MSDLRWNLSTLFDTSKPLEIELGCGKARFLIGQAQENPKTNFLGIERISKWARIAQRRGEKRTSGNLRIIKADIRKIMEEALASAAISVFHIYFPDPWPKRRHQKRRLIDASFLKLIHDRLKPGGLVELATDFEEYFRAVQSLVEQQSRLWRTIRNSINNRLMNGPEKTNYETKYIKAGRPIYYLELQK
jgi:tRNA (guanine-N7-)-methyltransferase